MNLPDYETLLAIGVTLVMAGVILRGFAAQTRRDIARRKEHRIDAGNSTVRPAGLSGISACSPM